MSGMSAPQDGVPTIDADAQYVAVVTCPVCGDITYLPLVIQSKLERLRSKASLGLKVTAGKRDHECAEPQ